MNKMLLGFIMAVGVCASASAAEFSGLKMQEDAVLAAPQLNARVNVAALRRAEELLAILRKDLPQENEAADYLSGKIAGLEASTGELIALLSKNREDDELHAYVLSEALRALAQKPAYNAYSVCVLEAVCYCAKERIGYHQETGDLKNLMVRAMIAGLKEAKTLAQSDDYLSLLYQYTRQALPITRNVAGNLLGRLLKDVKELPLALHIKRTAELIVL